MLPAKAGDFRDNLKKKRPHLSGQNITATGDGPRCSLVSGTLLPTFPTNQRFWLTVSVGLCPIGQVSGIWNEPIQKVKE